MPIKKSRNFDLATDIINTTKNRLSEFLTNEELAKTEVFVNDGKIGFRADDSILKKIELNFGAPAKRE
ncbi:hypothetical protein [Oceanimonas sp. GK1]|uniref:hypothetical protein n=1 Tax=Oceanimonas sp. (strain GK1 / IBRC-M 10197) TaxID=511062 RepID=UPI0005A05DED|nr:hypothetical protein [Oceanimonas sp. GK1]